MKPAMHLRRGNIPVTETPIDYSPPYAPPPAVPPRRVPKHAFESFTAETAPENGDTAIPRSNTMGPGLRKGDERSITNPVGFTPSSAPIPVASDSPASPGRPRNRQIPPAVAPTEPLPFAKPLGKGVLPEQQELSTPLSPPTHGVQPPHMRSPPQSELSTPSTSSSRSSRSSRREHSPFKGVLGFVEWCTRDECHTATIILVGGGGERRQQGTRMERMAERAHGRQQQ